MAYLTISDTLVAAYAPLTGRLVERGRAFSVTRSCTHQETRAAVLTGRFRPAFTTPTLALLATNSKW